MIVHQAVVDKFVQLLLSKTRGINNDMDTVIDIRSASAFEAKVKDAHQRGAKFLFDNLRDGALYSPTVLDHVPADCQLMAEETFGSMSPMRFASRIQRLTVCPRRSASMASITSRVSSASCRSAVSTSAKFPLIAWS